MHWTRRLLARQQAIGFLLDHGIALATQFFQLGPVQYGNLPAGVADDTELIQLAGCFGNTFTTYGKR